MSGMAIIRPTRAASILRRVRLSTILPTARTLHSLSTSKLPINQRNPQLRLLRALNISNPTKRTYSSLKNSSGKAEADLLVEELQELYEVAKDEFEIATESTDTSTIYAASDRESARDALNQLSSVYGLYTAKPGEVENDSAAEEAGDGPIIETNHNPAEISQGVKDEVRRRVGQRIRELKNAVEALEERASEH